MLESMQFIYIMGMMNDIDRAIEKYIAKYDIQLEYALKEIADTKGMESCLSENPYTIHMIKADKLAQNLNLIADAWTSMSELQAIETIEMAYDFFDRRADYFKELEVRRDVIKGVINDLEPFVSMKVDMPLLKEMEFIKFRFGKMPIVNFQQFEIYIHDKEDIIFIESTRDSAYVYGVYFVPDVRGEKVDSILSSLNFEQIIIPFEYEDQVFFETPAKAYELMQVELDLCTKEIRAKHNETIYTFGMNISDIASAYNTLKKLQSLYELRKYAVKTCNDYYVFVGWATESEAERMKWDIDSDEKIMLMNEEPKASQSSTPPTSLKNNPIVSPFEFFVRAYGLPKYGEIDPTPFVAGTYLILFGMMFGDLGQGAVLSLAGYLFHKFKGVELGKILGSVGISSMFFGLMYGSVFGIEHMLPTIWMKPAENVNSILFMTLGCGIVLILVAMSLNIANAIRLKDRARLFFGPNGVAGMVFYIGIIAIITDFVYGSRRLGTILVVPFVIVPLSIIAFRNQIGSYLETKKLNIEGGAALFILERAIETFEILLTYFTNTVSFVRVGAFALSHAGMMSVVLLLAGGEGNLSLPVMIVGNVLVIGMEGLVVGIQALRIEFYELFSRYYEGGGREFVPSYGSDIKYVA